MNEEQLKTRLTDLEAFRSTFRGLLSYHTRIYDVHKRCFGDVGDCEQSGAENCPYLEGQKDYYIEALKTAIGFLTGRLIILNNSLLSLTESSLIRKLTAFFRQRIVRARGLTNGRNRKTMV